MEMGTIYLIFTNPLHNNTIQKKIRKKMQKSMHFLGDLLKETGRNPPQTSAATESRGRWLRGQKGALGARRRGEATQQSKGACCACFALCPK